MRWWDVSDVVWPPRVILCMSPSCRLPDDNDNDRILLAYAQSVCEDAARAAEYIESVAVAWHSSAPLYSIHPITTQIKGTHSFSFLVQIPSPQLPLAASSTQQISHSHNNYITWYVLLNLFFAYRSRVFFHAQPTQIQTQTQKETDSMDLSPGPEQGQTDATN